MATASQASSRNKTDVYTNIASAAESGWDFSSRWFSRDFNRTNQSQWMTFINTRDVVPVDLNSLLCWNERLLSQFYSTLGKHF